MIFSIQNMFKKDKQLKNFYLVITAPEKSEYSEYYTITQDKGISDEFTIFRNFTLEDCKNHIEWWVDETRNKATPNLLFFIRITYESAEIYNENNSRLIGFICISTASPGDFAYTGYFNLLNFGIISEFKNRGLMTTAMKMSIERFKELGYNLLPAFVKHDNLARMRVLEKCGFNYLNEPGSLLSLIGKLYIFRLK
jgi:RimJ/RimL family protein N-acetyltransferase